MPTEPAYQPDLTKSRELIAMVERLAQEYAELRELSRVLRKDSMQLREDSYVLRRAGNGLLCRQNS